MDANTFSFGIVDYIVFFLMLIGSVGVGVYFGFFAKSKNTTDEYLMGDRKMKIVPIAISLVASQLTSLSIMSIPAETYNHGLIYVFFPIAILTIAPLLMYITFPIFYENKLSNCYEYLEKRFNRASRQVVTASFILNCGLDLPIVTFIPSLAFSQVTGYNIHFTNTAICTICIFYTMMGGIKAVVWTDVLQAGIMISAIFLVGIMGTVEVGGLTEVLKYAKDGGRLEFSTSIDPRTRMTIWNGYLTAAMFWINHIGLKQSCVQRILSLPTIQHAKKSVLITAFGIFLITGFSCYIGLVMYSYYRNCDPISAGHVQKADKMVPFFVQNIVGHLQGMPGIFISCVFSASLSTLSATSNSIAGIIYFDYIRPFVRHTDAKANFIMKICVVVMGIYCVIGGFVVQHFNSIMQMIITITGINVGAIVGLFLLGMFVPRVNGKIALTSFILTLLIMAWIIVNAQIRLKYGILKYPPLPMRTDGCEEMNIEILSNVTVIRNASATEIYSLEQKDFSIYDISFCWYKVSGLILIWIVAIILSFIWKSDESDKRDPKLYSHFIRKPLRKDSIEMEEQRPLKIPLKIAAPQN